MWARVKGKQTKQKREGFLMPSDRARVREDAVFIGLDDWIMPPPIYNAGESVRFDVAPLTLSSIENMLGMSSTVDIISNIKSYIMSNLSSVTEATKNEAESKIDRLLDALGRDNYMPTRRVYRTPPTHTVYLDDKSVEQFINKISKCRYIKWRLASPIYWGVDHIGIEGTFKR